MNSLLLYASPLDDNNVITEKNKQNDNTYINKKKNKTQKNLNRSDDIYFNKKLSNLINAIHNNYDDDEDNNIYHNFSPLNPPESIGVQNTIIKENKEKQNQNYSDNKLQNEEYEKNNNINTIENTSNYISPFESDNIQSQDNYNNSKNYFDNIIPNFSLNGNQINTDYNTSTNSENHNNIIVEKLNYLIHLLEEKQDEKTSNVLEEVILYSFLGIFIIFVIDSFVKVGKYTR